MEEALKGLCGITAKFNNGTYSLDILGAFFLLLGAIASKLGGNPWELIKSLTVIDPPAANLNSHILPDQQPKIAGRSIELLFNMFLELIENKDAPHQLLIQKVHLTPEYLEVHVGFDPFSERQNHPMLPTQVVHALGKMFRHGKYGLTSEAKKEQANDQTNALNLPEGHSGTVSKAVAEFVHLLNIHSVAKDHALLFPHGSFHLRTKSENGKHLTIFRFNKCKTS